MAGPAEDLAQDLERWGGWLQARLAPHPVSFTGVSSSPSNEARWRIEFPSGRAARLHIPTYLIGGGEETFHWVTMGMETYDWILLLRRGESTVFEVNRNGMLLGREPGSGAGPEGA